MKVVNPNNSNHTINIISRFYPTLNIDLLLYNESTQVEANVINTYIIQDGYVYVNFDFIFLENDRFRIEILQGNDIIYRGKLIATAEETQNYQTDNNEYYYE
jgi:hypothetical protein